MPFGSVIPANLSYATAKKVLSEGELDRLLCAYFNSTEPVKYDAERAVAEFSSTGSADSFKKTVGQAQNKIRKNMDNPKTTEDADDAEIGASSPAKPKAKGGCKRKAEGDTGRDPAPKKRGRATKRKSPAPVPEADEDDAAVKGEEVDIV